MKNMSPSSFSKCALGAPEAEICQTAKDLAALFNRDAVDAPDALLTACPAPRNTVDALRVLLDSENPENGTKSQSGANASGTFKSRGRQINVTSHGGQAAGRDIVTGKKSRKHE